VTPAREAARALLRRRPLAGRRPPRTVEETALYRAIVAYEGSDWSGWQRQHEPVSVAEMLEAAIELATEAPTSVHAAGRTDAGVHAEGQAISFTSPTALPADGLRSICDMILPPSIRVAHLEPAPGGWNPQRDAVRKLYRYRLLEAPRPAPARERTAWRVGARLDLDRLRAGAAHLLGRHDFRAFRNDPGPERRGEDTVREIERLEVERVEDSVRLDVQGPGFLYMMVRNVTAALTEVALGRQDPAWIGTLLASRDRREGPPPAPPQGLTLVRVWYADGFGDDLFE
jgi:tRNA pseudouridine38-40 synthase